MSLINALRKLEAKGFTLAEVITYMEKSGMAWSVEVSSKLLNEFLKGYEDGKKTSK